MPEGPTSPRPRPGRPRTGLAWVAILVLVAGIAALQAGAGAGREDGAAADFLVEVQIEVQFGAQSLLESASPGAATAPGSPTYGELESLLGGGPPSRRLRFAVVAAEHRGPAEALRVIEGAEEALRLREGPPPPETSTVVDALRALYAGGGDRLDPDAPGRLTAAQRDALAREMGWVGRLALAPPGSPDRDRVAEEARRFAAAYLGGILLGLLLLGAGLVAAFVFWLRVGLTGRPAMRFATGGTPPGIYAETFALWLVAYLALARGGAAVAGALGRGDASLAITAVVMPLSLLVLAWPGIRGVPWRTVREDLGLRMPASPIADLAAGLSCWVMGLPLMAAGFLLSIVLLRIRAGLAGAPDPLESPGGPSHPVVGEALRGGNWTVIFLLAVVMAPAVEETVFRGVLYRHLRDATGGAGRAISAFLSAAVSGVIFAAIHPQGLAMVPALAAVGIALAHAREWRGSLLAPMAAHAVHNGLLVLGFRLLASSR
jgi:membrane protease YdiL (CAAX protease family)